MTFAFNRKSGKRGAIAAFNRFAPVARKENPMRSRFMASLAAFFLSACAASTASTPKRPPEAPSLAGTWTLTAADVLLEDGSRTHAYGDGPIGRLFVDEDGRYSIEIFRSDRRPFASGDKRKGTPEEYQAASIGVSAHYGSCAIDPGGATITFHVERAAFPNWEGATQVRTFTLRGDDLEYRGDSGGRVAITGWHRLRSPR